MNAAAWKINGDKAELAGGSVSASILFARPWSGLRGVVWNQLEVDGELLGVELPEAEHQPLVVSDSYGRGDDLVVTFADTPQWQLRAQIYWRVARSLAETVAALELIVSLQTSLLDVPAEASTLSRVSADEVLYLSSDQRNFHELARSSLPQVISSSKASGCIVFRLASANLSYVEIVHPSDFRETTVEAVPELHVDDPATLCRHRLFRRRLEKGVILRGRILGVLMPQDDDLRLARQFYKSFAASEPVLTA